MQNEILAELLAVWLNTGNAGVSPTICAEAAGY